MTEQIFTGKLYRGVSISLLWSTAYSAPFWLTYKQAQEFGGSVRSGEKGTQIVSYKQLKGKGQQGEEQPEHTNPEKNERGPFVLTYYTVFNVVIGCREAQSLIIMDATNGRVTGNVPIGRGVDATGVFGSQAFASAGDATLTIAQRSADGKYELVESVKTAIGARHWELTPLYLKGLYALFHNYGNRWDDSFATTFTPAGQSCVGLLPTPSENKP